MAVDDGELVKAGVEGFTSGALRSVNELIQALFGPAAEEAGLMLKDHVTHYRAERRMRFYQRTAALLERMGVSPKPVPLKLLLPIVENASIEGADSLQDRWANLLANAANPQETNGVSLSFPGILRELSAKDVKFLDALFAEAFRRTSRPHVKGGIESIVFSDTDLLSVFSDAGLARYPARQRLTMAEAAREDVQADLRDIGFCTGLFLRHGVIDKVFEVPVPRGTTRTLKVGTSFSFTYLGGSFVRACREPSGPSPAVIEAS